MVRVRPERSHVSPDSLGLIGIPKKFRGVTVEDFQTYGSDNLESVKTFVRAYISTLHDVFESGQGILFLGENGVGKTMLACAIAREAYRLRYSVRRVTFVEYIANYARGWGATKAEREESEDDLNSRYKGVEFLVLEEVGKEIESKIAVPVLEDLLRYREEKGYVTIICTNMTRENFLEKYGKSCVSLVNGTMTPIKINSADRRKEYYERRLNGDDI